MKISTYLTRLIQLLALCAIVAGTAAAAAGAGQPRVTTQPGDRIVDDYFRDPPAVTAPVGERIVDDYWRDPPAATPLPVDRIVDDYFRDPPAATVAQPTGRGFGWGDWAIGVVAGLGLALGIAGTLILAHRTPRLRKSGAAEAG